MSKTVHETLKVKCADKTDSQQYNGCIMLRGRALAMQQHANKLFHNTRLQYHLYP